MKVTIELDLGHDHGTGRDDPERVADCLFHQRLHGQAINPGANDEARYHVLSYTLVSGEPETDGEGADLDVLPEEVPTA